VKESDRRHFAALKNSRRFRDLPNVPGMR